MRHHPALQSLVVGGGTAAVAAVAAVAVARWVGPVPAAVVGASIVAASFAWRGADGLVAFGLAILLVDTVEYWTAVDLRYFDEAAIPLFMAGALLVHRQHLTVPRIGWREGALATLAAAGVASSITNHVPASVWIPALALLAKGFVFFYLVESMSINADAIRRISGALLIVGLAIIAIGILQFIAPEVAGRVFALPVVDQQRGALQVVSSLFTHPALYGWISAFLALFLFAWGTSRKGRWALPLSVGLGVASVLSGRRTPILGLAVGVVTAVARQVTVKKARVRTVAMAVGLLVVMAAVAIPLLGAFYRWTLVEYLEPPERIAELLSESPDPEAISGMAPRNALYVGSVAVARDYAPLGAGLGRFGSHMSREVFSPIYQDYGMDKVYGLGPDNTVAVTDTFWPMVLGETGVIGLLAAMSFFAIVGMRLWRAAARPLPPVIAAFVLGSLLVYVESLVRSLTSPLFVAPPVAYFAFGSAALAIAAVRTYEAPLAERP